MLPFDIVIKIMLLITTVIFLFYSAVYLLLYELNVQPKLARVYRNLSVILAGGGMIFLAIYLMI
ncbi:hypothetical protein J5U23_02912 [Saccharolobus shibatae B12]|uniref:Uncharacterized protein n=1 Tax=Saccharolobus shibatae (strain ATCC 51178 / DSM 5389 / JCM 8931 / NBRC 15437 / B12) TaxID=523848 RepID=A0A8F5BL28_SACSH|nr:hypothetical protein [Saccharolobus shibatae]QXJ27130.1 hypothetical protein J5U23_p2912 [Saccharolobus shibatae B12]QXJ30023.1 hypothetical protein J5U23_02912 [Saccharolobus shibatae B12]